MNLKISKNYFWEYSILLAGIIIFAFSLFLRWHNSNKTSIKKETSFIEKQLREREKDFENTLKDSALLYRLIQGRESFSDVQRLHQKPYFFYIYKQETNNDQLIFWSSDHVLPSNELLTGASVKGLNLLPNGYYYFLKNALPDHPGYFAYCLILVKLNFFIETEYFKNSFAFDTQIDNVADISVNATTPYPIKSIDGQTLFYLKEKTGTTIGKNDYTTVSLNIIGIFLIIFSLFLLFSNYKIQEDTQQNIFLFFVFLFILRSAIYFLGKILHYEQLGLFNSSIFNSTFLFSSPGGLLINSILFCWFSVFLWENIVTLLNKSVEKLTVVKKKVLGFFLTFILVILTFGVAHTIRGLILNSKFSFDVTNFFSLDIFTVIGFIIIVFIIIGYFYFTKILFQLIFNLFKDIKIAIYLSITIFGLLIITLFSQITLVSLYLPCLVWLLLLTLISQYEQVLNISHLSTTSGIVFWIAVFSISVSFLMLPEINRAELSSRREYIEKLSTQTDPSSERLINIANKYLDNRFFIENFSRLYNETENKKIRDSIISKNYISYLSKYDTFIYLFDSLNHPLYNPDGNTLEVLNTVIKNQSKQTAFSDIYLYQSDYNKYFYLTKRAIKDSDNLLIGTVFIISTPKKYGRVHINPQLFKQTEQWELSNSPTYQYAIYQNGILAESSKNYPFTYSLSKEELPLKRFDIREQNGYSELWYRSSKEKTVVIIKKSRMLLELITLFSYTFGFFLITIVVSVVFSALLNKFYKRQYSKTKWLFFSTIQNQIHSSYLIIIVSAFIIIGIASIYFVHNRYENVNNEKLSRTLNIMLNEIGTGDEIDSLVYNHSSSSDSLTPKYLKDLINTISEIHGVDINIYDLNGSLKATSQPDVYNRGILSTQISPLAYYQMLQMRKIEYVHKEGISNLSFSSIYGPIRNSEGKTFAFLNIPYFTSQLELNQEISDFFVTLINIIAFIFVITGIIALLMANRITNSFKLIGAKMREISLSKINEPIVWKKEDEINDLVKEYNKMVDKLQESAGAIAKNERDEAWREMARQVAHEIKNPLTPMKLNLQYLQKAINEGRTDIHQLASKVSETMVEQIDHLSKIASDFSQFSNINKPDKTEFDLHEVLRPLLEIHSRNPKIQTEWNRLPNSLNIFADKTQMNRLFSNLLVNAQEACSGREGSKIIINEQIANNLITICVQDNGPGIDEKMKSKIFYPNFTTKSSGTGLGLAMCKNIVEQNGGSIWFETEIDKGATFNVTLPLIDL